MNRINGQLAHLLAAVLLLACDGQTLGGYPDPTVTDRPHPSDGCPVKAKVTIPLGVGVESEIDPKLLQPGSAGGQTNSRFGRRGEVVKRTGTALLSNGLLGTTDTLPASWAMGTLGGCLVSLSGVGDHPANMYSPTALQWATDATSGLRSTGRRGPIVATPTRVAGIGRESDVAYGSGYFFVTWVDVTSAATPAVFQAAIDATTGRKVFERSVNDGLGSIQNRGVRVVNGYAVFVRDTTANDLAFDAWQISNLDAGPTTTVFPTAASTFVTSSTFDMFVRNATTVTAIYVVAGVATAVDFTPSVPVAAGFTPLDQAGLSIPVDVAQNWMVDPGAAGKLTLVTVGAAAGLRVHWDINVGTTLPARTDVIDAAPGPVGNVVGFTRTSLAAGEYTVLYDNFNLSPTAIIKTGARTAGVLTGGTVMYRGQALRSKVWKQGTDFYVGSELPSTVQGTRFVLRVPADTSTRPTHLATFQIRGGFAGGQTSAVVSPAANTWAFVDTAQIRSTGQPVGASAHGTGIELVTVSFKSMPDATTGPPREAINSLFVPGGALGQLDGTVYAEAGFAYFPETPPAPALAGGGALTAGATYYWKFTYTYLDSYGRRWRSAPSFVLSQAMGASTKATFAVPTLRTLGRTGALIEAWRGAANDSSTFQLVVTVNNDPTVDSVTLVDAVSDTAQAAGEFLYTNGGGVLANDSIPGFTAIAIAGNRMFGISADDTSVLWVSNLFVDGQGLRFSEQNKIVVRDTHGGFYGIAAQPNGNVVALKADATYVLSGDGPDAAGRGAFTVTLISSDVGTRNPRSVVETSEGVEFQSTSTRAGWYRVGTGLSVDYIGAPVEAYSGRTIVGGILVPSRSEIRWYTTLGEVLVRDLVTGGWSVDVFADIRPLAVTAYNGGAAMYDENNGQVVVDDATIYTDKGQPFIHQAETPWIKMADLKGYERFRRIQGVGETVAAHTLTITLFKDFDTSTPMTAPQTVTPGTLWDWEVRYSAKVAALKVRIAYTSSNAGAKMSDVVVEYVTKTGLRPLAASKRAA